MAVQPAPRLEDLLRADEPTAAPACGSLGSATLGAGPNDPCILRLQRLFALSGAAWRQVSRRLLAWAPFLALDKVDCVGPLGVPWLGIPSCLRTSGGAQRPLNRRRRVRTRAPRSGRMGSRRAAGPVAGSSGESTRRKQEEPTGYELLGDGAAYAPGLPPGRGAHSATSTFRYGLHDGAVQAPCAARAPVWDLLQAAVKTVITRRTLHRSNFRDADQHAGGLRGLFACGPWAPGASAHA